MCPIAYGLVPAPPPGYTVTVHQSNIDSFNRTETASFVRRADVEHARTVTQWAVMSSHVDDTLELRRGDLAAPTDFTVTTLPDGSTKMCTPRPLINPVSSDWAWLADPGTTDEGPSAEFPGCEKWQLTTRNKFGNTTYVLHTKGSSFTPVAQVVMGFTMAPSGKARIATAVSRYSGWNATAPDPAAFAVPAACGKAPNTAVLAPGVLTVDPTATKP